MFCETPTIDIEKFKRTRRMKREANVTSLIDELGIEMMIAFILDGVPDFRNLTGTPLEEYSQLDVFANPVFIGFGTSSNTLMFTSTWPVEDKYLEIKVKTKIQGCFPPSNFCRISTKNGIRISAFDNISTLGVPMLVLSHCQWRTIHNCQPAILFFIFYQSLSLEDLCQSTTL